MTIRAFTTLTFLAFTATALAQPPNGPPPEAFDACANRPHGAACSFATPRGTLEGTCQTPRGNDLVCVPNDAPPPPRR